MSVGTSLTSDSDTSNSTTYTTASISPSAGKLLLMGVAVAVGSAPTPTITVTGCGVTWVEETTTDISFSRATHIFRAMGTPTPGALTITAGSTLSVCGWNVTEFSDTDTSGTNGSGAIAQSYNNRTPSGTSTSDTFPVTVDPANATYAALEVAVQSTPSPGSGWTTAGSSNQSAPTTGFLFEYANTAQQTIGSSWTGSALGYLAAVEIKASSAPAFSGPLDRTGSGVLAFTVAALTLSGSLARTGSGTAVFTPGFVTAAGSLARTGSGTVAFGASAAVSGGLAQSGSGSTVWGGKPGGLAALARSGSGTTAWSGTGTGSAVVSLSGSGTVVFSPVAMTALGTLARTGSGTAAFGALVAFVGLLARTGSGALSLTGRPAASGSLVRTGTGFLSLFVISYLQVWSGFGWLPRHAEVLDGTTWRSDVPVTVIESPGRLGR